MEYSRLKMVRDGGGGSTEVEALRRGYLSYCGDARLW